MGKDVTYCQEINTPFIWSSNHQANIQQTHSKFTCTTCAL